MPTAAPPTDSDDILDSASVSRWIKIPPGTLRNWRSRGVGPASFRLGGRVVYRRRAVEAWLATQELSTKRGGVE